MIQTITSIETYMLQKGVRYWSEVYVGVSKDPKGRLFNEHRVRKVGIWIYLPTLSSKVARAVEAYCIRQGSDGGTGGGDKTAIYVYAYKKTIHTVE